MTLSITINTKVPTFSITSWCVVTLSELRSSQFNSQLFSSMGDVGTADYHGTPSHLSVGGSSGWNTPTPTWTEGTPSYTESSKSGLEGLGQSSLDDVCDVCLLGLSGVVLFSHFYFIFFVFFGRLQFRERQSTALAVLTFSYQPGAFIVKLFTVVANSVP